MPMTATEGTLLKILQSIQRTESIQVELLALQKKQASGCTVKPPYHVSLEPGAVMVNPAPYPTDTVENLRRQMGMSDGGLSKLLTDAASEMVRQQLEFEAKMPEAPEGYHWEATTNWDDGFKQNLDGSNNFSITTTYVLQPIPACPAGDS